MPIILYSTLLALGLALASPWWLWRIVASERYREGLAGRLGRKPHSLDATIAQRAAAPGLVWLHAVSVGEVLAAQRLLAELRTALPTHLIVVSTTTQTGQQIAREKLNGLTVFYYPLDFAFAVRPYLRALRPTLFLTVESEFWPRMIVECSRAGIPIAVVNARISDRSFPRYLRLRRFWQPFLNKITIFLPQGEETATRLRALGIPADRIQTTGNLKYDSPGGGENAMTKRISSLLWQSRIVIAGSTAEGEEQMLLEAWQMIQKAVPDAVLLLAPRHPQRFDEVIALARRSGYPYFRCSQLLTDTEPIFGGTLLILDSIGNLASIYSLASVAFVGGSLVPKGGQNPSEPARFGIPVLMGPHYENFREMVATMLQQGTIRIVDREQLTSAVIEAMAEAKPSPDHFQGLTGATQRTVKALLELQP